MKYYNYIYLIHNDNYYLSLASSYEAFEAAILIHDDIIDNSNLRRGKATIHKLYEDEFNKYTRDNTPESLALCIGDISFFIVYEYLVNHYKKVIVIDPRYYKSSIIDYINSNNINKVLFVYNMNTMDTDAGIYTID